MSIANSPLYLLKPIKPFVGLLLPCSKRLKKDDHSTTEDIQEVEKYKNGNELTRTALAGSDNERHAIS